MKMLLAVDKSGNSAIMQLPFTEAMTLFITQAAAELEERSGGAFKVNQILSQRNGDGNYPMDLRNHQALAPTLEDKRVFAKAMNKAFNLAHQDTILGLVRKNGALLQASSSGQGLHLFWSAADLGLGPVPSTGNLP